MTNKELQVAQLLRDTMDEYASNELVELVIAELEVLLRERDIRNEQYKIPPESL